MQKTISKKALLILIILISTTFILTSCSGTKVKADGKLKKTDYCAYYREFEEKVPTASVKEQLKLIEKIASAKDFPENMRKDYDQIISAYKKSIAGEPVIKEEDINRKASEKINRHAIENCETLKSDNSSGGGI